MMHGIIEITITLFADIRQPFLEAELSLENMQREKDSLLERLRKGERKAQEELYDTWSPVLFSISMRYCGRREEAEDMLHESLMKIISGIKDFKPSFPGAFEAWMKRITVNQCLTFLRKRIEFISADNIEDKEQNLYEPDKDENEFPDLPAEEIIRMMHKLPPGYRTILNLYVFEQMSHKEIASELKISENTSKTQLFKARNAMKKQLENWMKVKEIAR